MDEQSEPDWAGFLQRTRPYNIELGIGFKESVEWFLRVVQEMLAEFEYLYKSQLRRKSALRGPNPEAVVSGPVTEVDAHSALLFAAACRQVFNAWNAAGVLNPHVKSFDGAVIPKLICAIEMTPSNRYTRIQSLNVIHAELRHEIDQLQNLVNVKNGGKTSNSVEMSDDETPKRRPRRNGSTLDPASITDAERRAVRSTLDTLAENPMTPIPSRDVLRAALKRNAIKIGNDALGVLHKEWKSDRTISPVRPRSPGRTD